MYSMQQPKAKMPAAGATQALRLFGNVHCVQFLLIFALF